MIFGRHRNFLAFAGLCVAVYYKKDLPIIVYFSDETTKLVCHKMSLFIFVPMKREKCLFRNCHDNGAKIGNIDCERK